MPKYKIPARISNIARQALALNNSLPPSKRAAQKIVDGKRQPGTGIKTARKLISGSIDTEQMILMRAWFARHGKSEKEAEARQASNSKAAIAWALWGGTAARIWVNRKLRELKL